MEKEKVISILGFFKTIDNEVQDNEREIADIEETYYNPLQGVNMDGLPHGKGGFTSTTETTALNVPASACDSLEALKKRNELLREVKREIRQELNGIDYTYRAVLCSFYFEGAQWVRISERLHYSPRHCQNLRDIGIELLAKRFENTTVISDFPFPA